MEKMA